MRREATDQSRTRQEIVSDALGGDVAKELWSAGYHPSLPFFPHNFALGSVLPAVLYMMRWGHRRGRGRFEAEYGSRPTIAQIAERLSQEKGLDGFVRDTERAILGDLLLAFCLENRSRKEGREEPAVGRVLPSHYFASWVDLPRMVVNLRGVPEAMVTILAEQRNGETVTREGRGHFPLGAGFERNNLLRLFGPGVSIATQEDSLSSDRFDERTQIGIDQLLGVRLGQSLREAPMKLRGENPLIPNQFPAAGRAAKHFREDLNVFLRAYGDRVPRQSLLPMLESGMAVGLSNIYFSTLDVLLKWASSGNLPPPDQQLAWPLFVDCSVSTDPELRRTSEETMDDLLQRLHRLPVLMMCLKILDLGTRQADQALPGSSPDPTDRINCLGDILFARHPESAQVRWLIQHYCSRLAETLEGTSEEFLVDELRDQGRHPAWRLAEAVVALMGDGSQIDLYRNCLHSALMVDEPNGLSCGRRSTVGGRRAERRSLVLTNPVLDFLVHRHLCKASKGTPRRRLSLARFLDILRDRYGYYVAEAPPGMPIRGELLHRNRAILERRLRDLGLHVGVNDAEAMKRLRPRYEVEDRPDD